MPSMSNGGKPDPLRDRKTYNVAIVCALAEEADAVIAALDYIFDRDDTVEVDDDDNNPYFFGVLGKHHVVVAQLPGMGKVDAAKAATNLSRSFPDVKICLVVGICGLVPTTRNSEGRVTRERLLGDVVVSTNITQYDFGKENEFKFVQKDTVLDVFGRPPPKLRGFSEQLKTQHYTNQLRSKLAGYLETILSKEGMERSSYPGWEVDQLYKVGCVHRHQEGACLLCDQKTFCSSATKTSCNSLGCPANCLVPRERINKIKALTEERKALADPAKDNLGLQLAKQPQIHLGTVGVADLVMKSCSSREALAEERGIIAFEMESVGAWDSFPTVVIKGGCDYADSHKNDVFHHYAAATAAACAKAFLEMYPMKGNVVYGSTTQPANSQPSNDKAAQSKNASNVQPARTNPPVVENAGPFSGGTWTAAGDINNYAGDDRRGP